MYKLNGRKEDIKALAAFLAGKKDGRDILRCLHIAPDYIEATDGRALLRINREMLNTDAAPGVYAIESNKAVGGGIVEVIISVQDLQYPATDNVIPAPGNIADAINVQISDNDLTLTRAVISIYTVTGNAYAYNQISKLAGIGGAWTVSGKPGEAKPIRLDYACGDVKYISIIMPFKMEEK